MNINQITKEILVNNLSAECEIIGSANLEDIISSDTEFITLNGGFSIDLKDILEIVTVASLFIKTGIDLYLSAQKNKKDNNISEIEVLSELVSNKDMFKKLDKDTQIKLIRAITDKIENI